jgi:hypothetical protein
LKTASYDLNQIRSLFLPIRHTAPLLMLTITDVPLKIGLPTFFINKVSCFICIKTGFPDFFTESSLLTFRFPGIYLLNILPAAFYGKGMDIMIVFPG